MWGDVLDVAPAPADDFWGEPISVYTVADGVADGTMVLPDPASCTEGGYRMPVTMTAAAYADLVEWDGDGWQDERGRLWDVLTMMRGAAKAAAANPGDRYQFQLMRVPFRTPSGKRSKAMTARLVTRHVVCQGYDRAGAPCLTVLMPDES